MKKIIIVAVAKNGVIGKANGEMPWHVKEEFQHFKNTTFGFPVIMGRKTFETLGKPLKGRLNVIVTRKKDFHFPSDDVKILHSLSDAVEYCESLGTEKIFIIGGGEIYSQAIPFVDEMLISRMDFDAEGEVKFPSFKMNDWEIVSAEKRSVFVIERYVRKENVSDE